MASHPSTALPIPPPTSSASRSTTTGSAPSASTSPVCSSLRTSPLTSWPSSASIRTRRLAVFPCAPATKTLTKLPPSNQDTLQVSTLRPFGLHLSASQHAQASPSLVSTALRALSAFQLHLLGPRCAAQ